LDEDENKLSFNHRAALGLDCGGCFVSFSEYISIIIIRP